MTSKIALKRAGTPADIAGLSAFLLGPSGSYITGQVMLVDGGLSLG
jgi:3-oxoacyl-[acyl-carrier protein] reductase